VTGRCLADLIQSVTQFGLFAQGDGKMLPAHSGQIGFGKTEQVHIERCGLVHEIEDILKRMLEGLGNGGGGKSDTHEQSLEVKVGHCQKCV